MSSPTCEPYVAAKPWSSQLLLERPKRTTLISMIDEQETSDRMVSDNTECGHCYIKISILPQISTHWFNNYLQVAIPIVPTIRVLITFTKFEELQPVEEFSTPLSSPAHFQDAKSKETEGSTSWISWMRGSRGGQSSDSESRCYKDEIDPFHIPSDYSWVDANEKKRRLKAKKAKGKKNRKQPTARTQVSETLE